MKKRTVFGLPLNPSGLIEQLAGHSLCVSYYHRGRLGRQIEDAMRLVGEDQILLVDNGAFSAWRSGAEMPSDYWDGFARWALGILDRCPQAVLVVPDVIGGNVEQNHELAVEFMSHLALDHGRGLDRDRCMAVWHLHEPIDYLLHMIEGGWQFIAMGSSGEYAKVGTAHWHGRIREAFAAMDELCQLGSGYRRPWVHLMRGQSMFHLYPFDSCDSCNVAVNHNIWGRRNPGPHHVSRFARVIKTRADASVSGIERELIDSPAGMAALCSDGVRMPPSMVRQRNLCFMGA